MKGRKSDITRKRIFECAIDLFLKKGFQETRVTEIARKAGVARGLLYYYFPGKEDILASFLREGLEEFLSRERAEVKGLKDTKSRIAHLFSKKFDRLSSNKELCRMFLQEFLLAGKKRKEFFRFHAEFLRFVEELIEEGKREGELSGETDSFQLSRILFSIYFSWLIAWINGHFAPHSTFKQVFGEAVDMVFRGVAP